MATNGNTAASRFTQRFTEAQKTAILRAVLADGHTVADARKMARAGQLGVPAFEIGTYAYTLVRDGRETFEANNEDALARAVADELRGAEIDALAEIRHIRRLAKTSGARDTTALAKATRDLAQIVKARKEAAGSNQRPKPKAPTVQTNAEPASAPDGAGVITSLLSKAEGQGKSGSVSRASNPAAAPNAA